MDPRKLLALGFIILGATCYWSSLISGTALALVFVPLSGSALGTLSQEQLGTGSALFNLMRHVGGSVGISFVNTIAQRHQQTHCNQLVHSLTITRMVVQSSISAQTASMERHVGPALALERAYSRIETTLNNQASLMAYIDDFRYLALLCVVGVFAVMLLRKTAGSAEPAA